MDKTGRELIEDYKSQIDLIGFLERDGFTVDRKKGLGAFITMRKDEITLIVFKDPSDQYRYFNRNDSADKGTVVDYYANTRNLDLSKGGADWGRLFEDMNVFIGHIPETKAHIKPESLPRETDQASTPVNRYLNLQPFSDRAYLYGRNLDDSTLSGFEFKNKVFNKEYLDKKSGNTYTNTAFPIENQNGFIGANIRNSGYNGIFGARQDGLWLSNVDPSRSPREIFITEAPIDAMSYHKMNPVAWPGQRLYIASIGSYAQRQVNFIQNLIDRYKPESVILGHDNDSAGKKFNLLLMGQLANGRSDRVDVSLQKGATQATLTVSEIKASDNSLNDLVNQVEEVLNAGTPESLPRAEVFPFHEDNNEVRLQITMPNTMPFLRRAEEFVRQHRHLAFVRVAEPIAKDFNVDLSNKVEAGEFRQTATYKPKR